MAEIVCPMCNGTALIRKDGRPVGSEHMTMKEIMEQHRPCICADGEKESKLWADWNEEMAKPILPREAVRA
jgi:hypothetical protein